MKTLRPLFIGLFLIGVLLFILGTIITFLPGAEQDWYIGTAVPIAFGLLVREKAFRIASILLLITCIIVAIEGHKHGVEYRKKLQEIHHQDH